MLFLVKLQYKTIGPDLFVKTLFNSNIYSLAKSIVCSAQILAKAEPIVSKFLFPRSLDLNRCGSLESVLPISSRYDQIMAHVSSMMSKDSK